MQNCDNHENNLLFVKTISDDLSENKIEVGLNRN